AVRAPSAGQRVEQRGLARPRWADYRDVDRQLLLVQVERLVKSPDSLLDLVASDQACDADLRRADHLDIDACIGQRAKHPARDTRRAEHAGTDDRELGDAS